MRSIVIIVLTSLLLFSCKQDPLDITPDGRISVEDVFKTELQAEAFLNSVYACIPKYFKFYEGFQSLAGITDEGEDSEIGNQPSMASKWNNGVLTPSNNPLIGNGPGPGGNTNNFYPTFWRGIYLSNVFLENIEKTTFANPDKKERVIAEARLLRAFFYVELTKQFGALPIVTKPFEPSFDYATLKRPTFQDITDFVIAECNEVIKVEGLPYTIVNAPELNRFSKALAYALKSQISLYNASPLWNPANDGQKWVKAANESKEALAVLKAQGYQLADNYEAYFYGTRKWNVTTDKETIFEIDNAWSIPLTTIGIPSKRGSWMIGPQPTQELVDAYDMAETGEPAILGYHDADHLNPIVNAASGYDPGNPYAGRDPRFYATVWYNGAQYDNIDGRIHTVETFLGGADELKKSGDTRINTHTGYYIRKFINPKIPIVADAGVQFKKYRFAEIYLNLAEAENEANGPTQDAYDAVNAIRNRVGMRSLPAGLTKDELRERIRRERRVELVWEEHRFWDVRRWNILDKTDKVVTGMEIRVANEPTDDIDIQNTGFENGTTGWTLTGGAVVTPIDGHTSAHVVSVGNGGEIKTTITGLLPNTTYNLTLLMYALSDVGYVGARNFGGSEVRQQAVPADAVRDQTVQFKTGPSNTSAEIFSFWPAGSDGLIDDFRIARARSEGEKFFSYTRFVVARRSAWQSKFLIFPIPIREVSIIPDFSQNQNPGW